MTQFPASSIRLVPGRSGQALLTTSFVDDREVTQRAVETPDVSCLVVDEQTPNAVKDCSVTIPTRHQDSCEIVVGGSSLGHSSLLQRRQTTQQHRLSLIPAAIKAGSDGLSVEVEGVPGNRLLLHRQVAPHSQRIHDRLRLRPLIDSHHRAFVATPPFLSTIRLILRGEHAVHASPSSTRRSHTRASTACTMNATIPP